MSQLRNRYFSAVSNTNHVQTVYNYVWDENAIISGTAGYITGSWRPVTATDLGAANAAEQFGFNIQVLTSGQFSIPAGARSYSIKIESGSASINSALINAVTTIDGGRLGNFVLGSAINVGCTGGRFLMTWEA